MSRKKGLCEDFLDIDDDDSYEDENTNFGISNDLDYHSSTGFDFCYINLFKKQNFQGAPLEFEYDTWTSVTKLKSLRTAGNNCCFKIK